MKRKLILAAAVSAVLVGCNEKAAEVDTKVADATPATGFALETDVQRVSYAMGSGLGMRIKEEPFDLDLAAFSEGMKHSVEGTESLMSDEEKATTMQNFQQQQMAKQQAEQEAVAEANRQQGEAFLAENGQKEGVVTTESGLQYKILAAGEGEKPAETDTVEVHYRGTLLDGTEFDSSYKRNSTVSFPVNGVIPGWVEALQLMPVGSKWELYIPSDLAYGPGGTGGGPIGPNAALVFEVELIAIKQKAEQPSES
jgi:FKBP-type peptidyl-prolyl cis-trans isomerase